MDEVIGRRLRALRWTQGVSIERIADLTGTTRQQIERYEAGADRLPANRLFELARLLDVPVSTLFENVELAPDEEGAEAPAVDGRSYRLAYELSRLPEAQRRAVMSLARSMSDEPVASGRRDGS